MRGTASKQGSHEVFLHMSNHYRRLYNAKCTVDTSAPNSYRRQQTSHIDLCDEALINLISNDTKQSPNSYMGRVCIDKGKQQCRSRTAGCRPPTRNFCKKLTNKVPPIDIVDRNAQNFSSPSKAFQPRILKTEAQSRVRDMRVYHPPCRRKKSCEQKSRAEEKWGEEVVSVQLSDLCSAQKIISSKESSRDSAYNGGISSGADTPEQASPLSDRYQLDASPSKSDSSPSASHICSESEKTIPSQPTSTKGDDAAYVHFLHNITEDVLARGIYSDRGLRQLFERHVLNNEGKLNMDRMRQEIANLCQQLGILEQDNYKGEMSTCMHSIEELMDVMRSVHRLNQSAQQDDGTTPVKRNTLHDIIIPVSQNTDKLENSAELIDVRTQTSTYSSDVGKELVNGSCHTEFSSEISEYEVAQSQPSEILINESCPETSKYEVTQPESHEECIDVSYQTSKISVISESVGSFTITLPEDDLEKVMSEFVDKDDQYSVFPYTRGAIADAAEEMIDGLDKYNVLSTLGLKEDIIKAAAELVTYVMERAIISCNINIHGSGI